MANAKESAARTLQLLKRHHKSSFVGAVIASVLLPVSAGFTQNTRAICSATNEHLLERFVASISNAPSVSTLGLPPISRWTRPSATIGVIRDKSARVLESYVPRNVAIFNAVGGLGVARLFSLNVVFDKTDVDIELEFLSRQMQQAVFRSLPIGPFLISREIDACRVYAIVDNPNEPVQFLKKAHILVHDEVSIDSLHTCIAEALVRALGLVHWQPEHALQADKHYEARVLLTALYKLPARPDLASAQQALAEAKKTFCN